eukprot:scaffold155630_cov20-Prasinocladus_malaysianus.AAC.1
MNQRAIFTVMGSAEHAVPTPSPEPPMNAAAVDSASSCSSASEVGSHAWASAGCLRYQAAMALLQGCISHQPCSLN